jgi:hypothetical protein
VVAYLHDNVKHTSQPSLMPAAVQKHFEYDAANLLDGLQPGTGLVVHSKLLTDDKNLADPLMNSKK